MIIRTMTCIMQYYQMLTASALTHGPLGTNDDIRLSTQKSLLGGPQTSLNT